MIIRRTLTVLAVLAIGWLGGTGALTNSTDGDVVRANPPTTTDWGNNEDPPPADGV